MMLNSLLFIVSGIKTGASSFMKPSTTYIVTVGYCIGASSFIEPSTILLQLATVLELVPSWNHQLYCYSWLLYWN